MIVGVGSRTGKLPCLATIRCAGFPQRELDFHPALSQVLVSGVQASGAISVHALVRVQYPDIAPAPIRARRALKGDGPSTRNFHHREVDAPLIPAHSGMARSPEFGTTY